ncbi:energy transducer TonB [Mucilaginibacter boryungensis]|uniref:TonB family protein n=1 Tax=Mucilaginibacter boryungensis TaxID=768480 RepID=A0ABR9XFU6_9SPHI|nr:energy transducer TonB [Mucilaginibacter boryungensis]MBE9666257.1 TonB family protein [Mucilaginibacter boryungensis]
MLISEFDLYKREWLSLVFKNRNQQYGAYELRSHYGSTMVRAMAITFFSVAAFGITETVISRSKPIEPGPDLVRVVPVTLPDDKVYKMPEKHKEAAKPKQEVKQQPPAAAKPVSTQNINYKPVEDNKVTEDPKPVDPNIASGTVDLKVEGSPVGTNAPLVTEGVKGGTGTGEDNGEKGINEVQVMPEPVGGVNAWSKFLQKNLRYPIMAQEAGASGKVFMSFIIEKDGHLSDITVMRKVGYGFDEEATRVLKIAPAWKPGMQNGQPVRVRYTIPINFQLTDQ